MKKVMAVLIVVLLCCGTGICSCAQVMRKSFVKSLLERGEVLERVYSEEFKDVKAAVEGNAKVSLLNRPCGEWLSVEEIVEAVETQIKKGVSYATSI